MTTVHKKRIRSVLNTLNADKNSSILILSNAPKKTLSRDQHYKYRPDSDFYYLTGIDAPDTVLVLSSLERTGTLYVSSEDKALVVWEGKGPDYKKIAKNLGLALCITNYPFADVIKQVKHHKICYYQNVPGSTGWNIAYDLITKQSDIRITGNFPTIFKHADCITEPLRLIKDSHEVKLIEKATEISLNGLKHTLALLDDGQKESDFSAVLECNIKLLGGQLAFESIVANGKSAATLHYWKMDGKFKSKDMALIDFGASYQYYASDITRVFPVSGCFLPWQAELYDVVLSAQKLAIKKIKAGVTAQQVQDVAIKEITIGLKELGVLKGNISNLISKKAYLPYFPHGIGHNLGIDTHDIGNMRANKQAQLKAGMVITIEPGVYFAQKTGNIPPCGIRIEDDMLVTSSGSKCLTQAFPKEMLEVEEFFNSIRDSLDFSM